MRKRRGTSWPSAGLTLIETVAATAILGGLLAAILTAQGRLAVQCARSEALQRGCDVLDGLLAGWLDAPEPLPVGESGDVPDRAGWRYRTRVAPDGCGEEALDAEVLIVELFAPDAAPPQGPAASVELLIPRPPAEGDEQDRETTP